MLVVVHKFNRLIFLRFLFKNHKNLKLKITGEGFSRKDGEIYDYRFRKENLIKYYEIVASQMGG